MSETYSMNPPNHGIEQGKQFLTVGKGRHICTLSMECAHGWTLKFIWQSTNMLIFALNF